ncbi:replication protein, partial [Arsenophonus nasoniae]|uniref:replication protein n=1 Tax=Arsenophonus nasoniae TaxID=638 RepID=UPI00387A7121
RAPITFRQYKIFDAIHRMTIGWGKDYDRITDMQLSEITGIHRTHINRAKSELIKLNMLSMFGDKIGVNQNFQAWNFSSNVTKSATKQCSPNSYSVAKSVTKNVAKSATINKHKKNPFKTSRCNKTVAKAATEHQNNDSVAESATKECSQTSYTPKKEKENKYNNIYPSLTLPSQNFDLRQILADSLRGEFQEFVDKSADELHQAVEQKIIGLGFDCSREFRVQERGDGRSGRIDLLVSDRRGNQCGIEIDANSPREKSLAKLAPLKSGIILLRKSSTAEDYLQEGILVIAGGISLPKIQTITKKSELDLSRFEQLPSELVWADYLQHRKNKKAPLTQTALNRLATAVNEANALGYSTDNVLAECMLRNWQGFNAAWLENKKSSNHRRDE